eukprot:3307150-Ditylum_brightwellii.AAC.1
MHNDDDETFAPPSSKEAAYALTDSIMAQALQITQPSLFDTTAASTILHAPCTECLNCLSPHHFHIVFCRRLQIPIMRRYCRCKCGQWIDIFGNHFFECCRHSKIWLHNCCRDTNLEWFQPVVDLAGLAPSPTAVRREPKSLSACFPGVRPLDLSVSTFTYSKGIDVTMTHLPAITPMPQDQPLSLLLTHTSNEVRKWRGTACPNLLKACKQGTPPQLIKGHVVVQDMLQSNIKLVPATIDPFGSEGPATKWLCFGSKRTSIFDTSTHKFGNAVGTAAGIKMCHQAMRDPDLCNILGCANKEWRHRHDGSKLFGFNYVESTPLAWSNNFLAAKFTWTFAQHVLWCIHNTDIFMAENLTPTSNDVSHTQAPSIAPT